MTGTAVVKAKEQALKQALAQVGTRVEAVLPARITDPQMRKRIAEKMLRVALLAATKQPKLYDCTPESVLQSVLTAASLGLEIGGVLGEGYLVPFFTGGKQTCQFVPGYRGLIKLAVQTGEVKQIEVRLVYTKDVFDVSFGTDPDITHLPDLASSEREDQHIVAAYMVATFADGSKQFEVMTRDEVLKVRAASKAAGSGPWVSWFGEMVKKTVVKRGMKLLPLTPDSFRLAVELDNRAERGGEILNPDPVLDEVLPVEAAKALNEAADVLEVGGVTAAERAEEAEYEVFEKGQL